MSLRRISQTSATIIALVQVIDEVKVLLCIVFEVFHDCVRASGCQFDTFSTASLFLAADSDTFNVDCLLLVDLEDDAVADDDDDDAADDDEDAAADDDGD
ncbi:hypothetical protein MBANPS3_002312 [Mucor bainieri]